MKHINPYLNLALTIALCASINTFAMEADGSNSSSESGLEGKDMLREQFYHLQSIINTINHRLKNDPYISDEESDKLRTLLQLGENTFQQALDMSSNLTPINIAFIEEKIRLIQNGEAEFIKTRKLLLQNQINHLGSIVNIIKQRLQDNKNISAEEYDQLKALLKYGHNAHMEATNMSLDALPTNIPSIDQKTNRIINRLHKILAY